MTSARLEKLIADFSLDRIQKKSAVFDEKKFDWVNKQHIQKYHTAELLFMIPYLTEKLKSVEDSGYMSDVIDLVKMRVNNLNDFESKTEYFFTDPISYEEKAMKKKWKDESVNALISSFEQLLSEIENWNTEHIEIALRNLAKREDISAGKIIHPTRLALSGSGSGPSLFDMMELLGKTSCLRRLQKALNVLPL
jgi:glutamyl-tRNA synthetase